MSVSSRGQCRQGFTLVELLIVTVVLGILAMVVAKPIGKARQRAMETAARAEMRTMMQAIDHYEIVHNRLPARVTELASAGYEPSRQFVVCIFSTTNPPTGPVVHIVARHRGMDYALYTLHPQSRGTIERAGVNC